MLDPTLLLYSGLRTMVQCTYLNEYARAAQDLVYLRLAKELRANALEMHFPTLVEDALIEDTGETGGEVQGREQAIGDFIFRQHVHKAFGFWNEFQLSDLSRSGIAGGDGIDLLQRWVANHAALAAYLPQRLVINTLRNGTAASMTTENGNSINLAQTQWDNLPLFSTTHLLNPKVASFGTFSNYFTGTSGGTWYPLAGPFGSGSAQITPAECLFNIFKMCSIVRGMKMSDGITPRRLRPTTVVCGPSCSENVTLALKAEFIAGNAGQYAGGSADISVLKTVLGMKEPVFLDELAPTDSSAPEKVKLATNEEYDWYLLCEEANQASDIGCLNIGVSLPWNMKLFTPDMMVELAKNNRVECIGQTRLFVGNGPPQFIYKNEGPRS